jgi:hypothetical protein
MAEGEGFEPPVRLPVRLISSQVPLTTQPPFHMLIVKTPDSNEQPVSRARNQRAVGNRSNKAYPILIIGEVFCTAPSPGQADCEIAQQSRVTVARLRLADLGKASANEQKISQGTPYQTESSRSWTPCVFSANGWKATCPKHALERAKKCPPLDNERLASALPYPRR